MRDAKKLISLIIPVLNEEENIHPFYDTVAPILEGLSERYDFEFVFTDNHSSDSTFDLLDGLAKKDDRIRVFRFSKNFGFQKSISTGYQKAKGQAVIQLDCDLQDPPSLIQDFLHLWEQGHQVVFGVRAKRWEGWVTHLSRKAYYRLINWLSEDDLPYDAGDFRLVDRRVVDLLNSIEDAQPYLRGTIASLGFKQIGVQYERAIRKRGKSKFPLAQLIHLAMDGIVNHSLVPLRLATYTGLTVSVLTLFATVTLIAGRVLYGQDWPAGFATLSVLILLSLSLNALFLGIIGEYLGRIYHQVKKRPFTVIEKAINEK